VRNGFSGLLAAAVLGGGVTAAVLLAAGVLDQGVTRTVVQPAPLASSAGGGGAESVRVATGLTARDIYRRDAPGVVYVQARSVQTQPSPFDLFPHAEENLSTGSGFVLDEHGNLLTNAHVVSGATEVRVTVSDQRTVEARVVGKDEDTDLAVLNIDPAGLDLRPLELGDSSTVHVGDPTVAIGNPFGLDRTLTTGVVSAKQRRIPAPNGFSIENVIQTDAAINPGNSGGPLIDAAGRVIGVNSQIATAEGSSGSVGIGFAVPIDTAKVVIPQLVRDHRVSRAYMGIAGRPVDGSIVPLTGDAKAGVLVERAFAGGPAERAGIRAGDVAQASADAPLAGGDVVVAIDGSPVRTMDDVTSLVARHRPGDGVAVELLRDGRRITVEVVLQERPATAPLG
jgi:S1-C subfamily serine protease